MKVLVCPPTLGIGGSQQNAIDLGGAVRKLGHEVTLLAPPGPLEDAVRRRGLTLIPLALQGTSRPALVAMKALRRVIRDQRIDVVHAYESAPGLEAFFGAGSVGVPIVVSVMSMTVPRRFPRSVPLIVGTELLEEACRRRGHHTVALLEPPVDTDGDAPSVDGSTFRHEHGIAHGTFALVTVSRLARSLKLQGLEMAIDAMSGLNGTPACLVIVGGGAESERVAARARELNRRLGRRAVVLTGPLTDPRPAYAAADVVLGMGGSVLRGMAFGKPSVVIGEGGFWRVVTRHTIDGFLHEGFYGLGEGVDPAGLAAELRELALDENRRRALGAFSRKVVCERFSLPVAATSLEKVYRHVLEAPPRRHIVEMVRVAAWVAGIKAKQRLSGTVRHGEAAIDGDRDRRLVGVLVTFRRPAELSTSLARLAAQDRPLDHLVVVDNDRSAHAADLVDEFVRQGNDASYVATPENLGPAGGIAIGMEHALRRARDADWIVLVDDDDPPDEPSVLSNMADFGAQMLAADPRTAGVGLVGARFDWRRGRLNRIGDAELIGAVPVDYIGGNQFPFYIASAVRDVGPFATNLFFGFDDLEYGLRLRRRGYRLFASGSLWLEQRRRQGRLGLHVRPAGALGDPGWRRYYSLRNTIHILRSNGRGATAARVAVVRGIAKPLANVPRGPRAAWRHLRLGARACRDGWMGKMGRTIEPDGYDGVDPRAVSG